MLLLPGTGMCVCFVCFFQNPQDPLEYLKNSIIHFPLQSSRQITYCKIHLKEAFIKAYWVTLLNIQFWWWNLPYTFKKCFITCCACIRMIVLLFILLRGYFPRVIDLPFYSSISIPFQRPFRYKSSWPHS